MTAETFTATIALIGIVILVSSLLSGVVERTGVPQVAIFLILGATLGPYGLGVFDLDTDHNLVGNVRAGRVVLLHVLGDHGAV